MTRPVEIVVRRRFAATVDEAFPWLTDIQDDDTDRAGAVLSSRKLRERGPDRLVYEGETEMFGVRTWGVTDVAFRPPDRWEARVVEGPRTGSTTDYVLVPAGAGCEITVTYRFVLDDPRRMFALRVLRPFARRELAKMWAGFAAALEAELKGRST